MHLSIRRAAQRAAIASSCLIVVQVCGAASSGVPARSKAKLAAAALAAQRDTDPALNGSISSLADLPGANAIQAAAEAARRDQDPLVNGAIGSAGIAGVATDAVAKR